MIEQEFFEPRIARDEWLRAYSKAMAFDGDRYLGNGCWRPRSPPGSSACGFQHGESFECFDRPIDQLMIDVLALLVDAGLSWGLWQERTRAHARNLLEEQGVGALLSELSDAERGEFCADLRSLSLIEGPLWPIELQSEPDPNLPLQKTNRAELNDILTAMGRHMAVFNRKRSLAPGQWVPVDPQLTQVAYAYNGVQAALKRPVERMMAAAAALCMDAGASHHPWQQTLWDQLLGVLNQHGVGALLAELAVPHEHGMVCYHLGFLKLLPTELDPRAKPPF